jgi:hypothetical protein
LQRIRSKKRGELCQFHTDNASAEVS